MLHLARLLARRSQHDLAASGGIATQTLSRYERGERPPALDAARRLAVELDVPLDLLDRTVELVAVELDGLRGLAQPGQVVAIVRIPPLADAEQDEVIGGVQRSQDLATEPQVQVEGSLGLEHAPPARVPQPNDASTPATSTAEISGRPLKQR